MILLALDLGTDIGWCRGLVGGGSPSCGTAELPSYSQSPGRYFASCADWVADMITTHRPDEIAVEQTLATVIGRGLFATQSLLGLRAVIELVCWRRETRLTWHASSTVRKAVCGSGHAKKDAVNAKIISLGCRPDSHNAADAAAVWFHRCRQLDREVPGPAIVRDRARADGLLEAAPCIDL